MSATTISDAPTVILTGASRGLGLATLEILLAQGCNVVALSRTSPPELNALAGKHPGSLLISVGDTSDDRTNEEAVAVTLQSYGRLDAVILNAGTLDPLGTTAGLKGKMDSYRNLLNVNVVALVSLLTYAVPHLVSAEGKGDKAGGIHGRVVLVSSGASTGGTPGWGAYNASKAAVNSIGRTLANEEPALSVVSVRPGTVLTQMQAEIRAQGKEHMTEADYAKFQALYTDGRLLAPELPGRSLAFLALGATKELSGSFINWDDEKVLAIIKAQSKDA